MGEPRPAGRKLYDWILRNVWLLPYDAEDILRMGEQELARLQAFTAFEEKRNEGQPKLVAAATTREYATRTEQEARRIRAFLEEKDAITIPSLVGPYRRTVMPDYLQAFALWNALSGYRTGDGGAVKYAVPETHPFRSTYWEAIMRTDPATNIFHDGIPGHHFQGLLAAENPCPGASRAQRALQERRVGHLLGRGRGAARLLLRPAQESRADLPAISACVPCASSWT